MFTYIDPNVRERLIAQGKLVRINARGETVSARASPPAGETTMSLLGPIPLPLRRRDLDLTVQWFAAVRHTELQKVEELAAELREQGAQRLFSVLASSMAVNSVLLIGAATEAEEPLVRIHSSCLTGDVFGSQRCECGPQLESALQRIAQEPEGGLLIYMAGHEGRGIGLWAKAITYLLQDAGEDTYQANESLGLPTDSRDFSDAGRILRFFRGDDVRIRLLGNNPLKRAGLEALGVEVVEQLPLVVGINEHNARYLGAKRAHGHRIPKDALDGE